MQADSRFHTDTFELLNVPSRISINARQAADTWEKETGRRLPRAMREWYELADAETLLQSGRYRSGIEGWVSSLDELLRTAASDESTPTSGYAVLIRDKYEWEPGYTVHEVWAVAFDGTDDPPVIMLGNESGKPPTASPLHDKFSGFIFAWLWAAQQGELSVSELNQPSLTLKELAKLKFLYPQSRTDRNGVFMTHYFLADYGRLRVVTTRDAEGETPFGNWDIDSDSAEGLYQILCELIGMAHLRKKLVGLRPVENEVLERVRRDFDDL